MVIVSTYWHLSPKPQYVESTISTKCMKTSKKFNFIKIVFVSISINRDMVMKWILGQLVQTDLFPLKRLIVQ